MSSTMISTGYIGVLVNPLSSDAYEDISEKLYDSKSIMDLNYDCSLVFSDVNKLKKYSEQEFNGDLLIVGQVQDKGREEFIGLCKSSGFEVDPTTIQPYTCIWYNGGDCPVNLMSKEEFLNGDFS